MTEHAQNGAAGLLYGAHAISGYLGLTGLVSMTYIRGKYGSYSAGNLFLFPWLKPKGFGNAWPASMPINATQYRQTNPIPIATLPLDEYFCRIVLRAPWPYFIGFAVDEPFGKDQATLAWFSNVDKLADGAGVGIDWTSANLNHPWFGGSHFIPNSDACYGNAWRQLIAGGLMQASSGVC